MNCSDVRDQLQAYDQGQLSGLFGRRISLHLDNCSKCREEHAALRRLNRALEGYAAPDTPPGLARRTNRVIGEVAGMNPPPPARWLRLTAALGVSVAALGAFLFAIQTHLAEPVASTAASLAERSAERTARAPAATTMGGGMEMLSAWSDLNNDTSRRVHHAGARALLSQAYAELMLDGKETEADDDPENVAAEVPENR